MWSHVGGCGIFEFGVWSHVGGCGIFEFGVWSQVGGCGMLVLTHRHVLLHNS